MTATLVAMIPEPSKLGKQMPYGWHDFKTLKGRKHMPHEWQADHRASKRQGNAIGNDSRAFKGLSIRSDASCSEVHGSVFELDVINIKPINTARGAICYGSFPLSQLQNIGLRAVVQHQHHKPPPAPSNLHFILCVACRISTAENCSRLCGS